MILFSSIPARAGLTQAQVSELYVTIFGRASEGSGNTYWQSQPVMATAAAAMLDTPAAKDYFGSSLDTNQAFIEHIYINTLNKTVANDPAGIGYWVGELNAGVPRGQVVASLIDAVKYYAPDSPYYNDGDDGGGGREGGVGQSSSEHQTTLAAYHRFQNRVEVSNYMADLVWPPPNDWATSTAFSATGLDITDNAASVTYGKTAVERIRDSISAIKLSRTSVELEAGGTTTIAISGGSIGYSVVNSNTQIASSKIIGSSLDISGISEGTITLVITDAQGVSTDVSVMVFICGAYVAPEVWKRFDCYNLAAIGKTTNDDPFTPSWRLIGGYWQWGRKGPDSSQWYDTNTPNFAHGPTGQTLENANSDKIREWDSSYATDDAWTDFYKTANDPCPEGFRVPTKAQWVGLLTTTPRTWLEPGRLIFGTRLTTALHCFSEMI